MGGRGSRSRGLGGGSEDNEPPTVRTALLGSLSTAVSTILGHAPLNTNQLRNLSDSSLREENAKASRVVFTFNTAMDNRAATVKADPSRNTQEFKDHTSAIRQKLNEAGNYATRINNEFNRRGLDT